MSSAHWLDRLAAKAVSRPRLYAPLFPEGWGRLDRYERYAAGLRQPPPAGAIDIAWAASSQADGARIGRFVSPHDDLPDATREARVLWVGQERERQVVMLAATNDHGWSTRLEVARHLADHNTGTLILENPYYGTRRVRSGQPLATVLDFLRMGSAMVAEARALLVWIDAAGHTPGVTGFSQGGAVAAHVSALSSIPVATACIAAGPSPGPVFTHGTLAARVDWAALGGVEDARPRLAEVLGAVTVTRYDPLPHTRKAIVAGARRDGYVPAEEVERLANHWPGSELVWIEAGHAIFHLRGKAIQAQLIDRSFRRFERS